MGVGFSNPEATTPVAGTSTAVNTTTELDSDTQTVDREDFGNGISCPRGKLKVRVNLNLYVTTGTELNIVQFASNPQRTYDFAVVDIKNLSDSAKGFCADMGDVLDVIFPKSVKGQWSQQINSMIKTKRSDQQVAWTSTKNLQQSNPISSVDPNRGKSLADAAEDSKRITNMSLLSVVHTPLPTYAASDDSTRRESIGVNEFVVCLGILVNDMKTLDQVINAGASEMLTLRNTQDGEQSQSPDLSNVSVSTTWTTFLDNEKPAPVNYGLIPLSVAQLDNRDSMYSVPFATCLSSFSKAVNAAYKDDLDSKLSVQQGWDTFTTSQLLRMEALPVMSGLQWRYWFKRLQPRPTVRGSAIAAAATIATSAIGLGISMGGPEELKRRAMSLVSTELVESEDRVKRVARILQAVDGVLARGKDSSNFSAELKTGDRAGEEEIDGVKEKARADYLYSHLFNMAEDVEVTLGIENNGTNSMLAAGKPRQSKGVRANKGQPQTAAESTLMTPVSPGTSPEHSSEIHARNPLFTPATSAEDSPKPSRSKGPFAGSVLMTPAGMQ